MTATIVKTSRVLGLVTGLLASITLLMTPLQAEAASAREIDASVTTALERFHQEVHGSQQLVQQSKGVLVMPKVVKAGLGFGGEYGQGALRIRGKTVNYYKMLAGSFGLQLGGQKKDIILLFMEQTALEKFQRSSGWKIGADASVALINSGAEGTIDSKTLNKPIIAFVIGQKGLMYDLSLEGAKFSKLKK